MPARKRLLAAAIVATGLALILASALLLAAGHRAAGLALGAFTAALGLLACDTLLVSVDLFGSSLRRGAVPPRAARPQGTAAGPRAAQARPAPRGLDARRLGHRAAGRRPHRRARHPRAGGGRDRAPARRLRHARDRSAP